MLVAQEVYIPDGKKLSKVIGLDFAKVSFEINQGNAEHCRIWEKPVLCL
jgi:hypothetical protein